jgi:integrase
MAAQAMLNEIVRKAERAAAGLIDAYDEHGKRPLLEHLDDYEQYLRDKGSTKNHVRATTQRARAVITGCKFERLKQITPGRVQEFLAGFRRQGHSICSSNHYLRAIKMFTRWLIRDRRATEDPLSHLSTINAQVDRRRVRRPLSMEEFERLLAATEKGRRIQCISGPDRAMLYIIGVYTGYRRNEIGSVTEQSFNFTSDPPTLTVAAGYSKHRKTDVIPLRRDIAERIQTWIAQKRKLKPNHPLLPVTGKRTAIMLAKDLAVARKGWLDEAQDPVELERRKASSFLLARNDAGYVVDFHALRMTFITNLTRSGVAPKTAQLLARHSDINLTMNTYTMLGVLDQASAVQSLPPIPQAGLQGRCASPGGALMTRRST